MHLTGNQQRQWRQFKIQQNEQREPGINRFNIFGKLNEKEQWRPWELS
jgi:hypothetical protein